DVRAGVEQATQADLGVLADETAHFGQARRHHPAARRDRHLTVVVAQVAALAAGAEVDPAADVTVPQKPVVVFVAVAVNDAALDLAADAAARAERGAAAQLRSQHVGARPDVARALQPAERLHDRPGRDRHRA